MNTDIFLHESDKAALDALKAIPGFSQIVKAFMKVWNEKQFKIINMSTNLRLSEKQLTKYYDMLKPICEKLNIDVPELYVTLDVMPNAYTYGDTNPFIVLTSGLFETVPDELIPTILAHECGHIVCHHTLYNTMARVILSGATQLLPFIGNVALYPIQLAFSYWLRCSEYSADRVAAICDGGSSKLVELCMRFAGYNKSILVEADPELFIEQAKEYIGMISDSTWNKTLEFMLMSNRSHPLNAVRAYEIKEWCNNINFEMIKNSFDKRVDLEEVLFEITPSSFVGKQVDDVYAYLTANGFINIIKERHTEFPKTVNRSIVTVTVNGDRSMKSGWFTKNVEIVLAYFENKTQNEIENENVGKVRVRESSKYYIGRHYFDVKLEFQVFGFDNIIEVTIPSTKSIFGSKKHTVAKIEVGGQSEFDANSWFNPNLEVIIYYYE